LNNIWVYSIISVVFVSLISLIGAVIIFINRELSKETLLNLVAFSAGSMLGGAFFHLLPEAVNTMNITSVSIGALTGILLSYSVEMFLTWRHCHIPSSENHPHTFVYMNLIGDGVHNFIDGVVIAGTYMVDIRIGIITTLAIILHEIPQEIGDFGVIVYGGVEARKAIYYNLLSGVTAIGGALLALLLGEYIEAFSVSIIPIALGNFLYIACSDLVPELKDEKNLSYGIIRLLLLVFGVSLLYFFTFLE